MVSVANASSNSPGRSRKSGLCGRPKRFVALGESFVDHGTARCHGVGDRGQQRPVQIFDDDDSIIATAKLPSLAVFEIDRLDRAACAGEWGQPRGVAIDGMDPVAAVEEQPRVTPAPRGEIEHAPARPDQRHEPRNPGGTGSFTTR